jgi:hypothetical protein
VIGSVWIQDNQNYLLVSCPKGYEIYAEFSFGLVNFSSQYCDPCPQGYECDTPNCTVCSPCPPGKYKEMKGSSLCIPCDINTFNPKVGSISRSDCLSCPCLSTTNGKIGQKSDFACICDSQYYKVVSSKVSKCQTCPKGAICTVDSSCSLARTQNATCTDSSEIVGTWVIDTNGKYILSDCPPGYSLLSSLKAGSEDLQECKPCLSPQQYILSPFDDCNTCPPGLLCNGNKEIRLLVPNSTWLQNGSIYLLTACPIGYKILLLQSFDPAAQQCVPCGKGEECKTYPCTTCSPCKPGYFKQEESTINCEACPENTYGTLPGGQDRASTCMSCPSNSGTRKALGQSTMASCICNEGYFMDLVTTSPNFGKCVKCPQGALCTGGNQPMFGQTVSTTISLSGISIHEFCCIVEIRATILSSLASVLGIQESLLNVQAACTNRIVEGCENQYRTWQRHGLIRPLLISNDYIRRAQLERNSIESLSLQFSAVTEPTLLSSVMSVLNSTKFLQQFAELSNITVVGISTPTIGTPSLDGRIYGPADDQGQYHLLGCSPGYLLVNNTVTTQDCLACQSGEYSFNTMDGCGQGKACIQRSCMKCPSGATCSGLSNFVPTVPESIWLLVFNPATLMFEMKLVSCPEGNRSLY